MRAHVKGSAHAGNKNVNVSGMEQNLQSVLPSLWNPTEKILILSKLPSRVPGFTFTPQNVTALTNAVLPCSEAVAIDLSENGLTTLRPIVSLLRTFPSLHSLSLAGNALPSPSRLTALEPFKGQLRNLIIGGNPFMSRVQPSLFAHHIAQIFPALMTLENQHLTPALMFELPPALLIAPRLPPAAGNYIGPSDDARNAAEMVACFLRVLDNRLPTLRDFFMPSATLNITADGDASNAWLNAMYGGQHSNAVKLYRGADEIAMALNRSPRCVHNVEAMKVTSVVTPAGVSLTGSCPVVDMDAKVSRLNEFSVMVFGGMIACMGMIISGSEKLGDAPLYEHPPIDEYGFLLQAPSAIPPEVIAAVQGLPIDEAAKQLVAEVMARCGCDASMAYQALQHSQGNVEGALTVLQQLMRPQ